MQLAVTKTIPKTIKLVVVIVYDRSKFRSR